MGPRHTLTFEQRFALYPAAAALLLALATTGCDHDSSRGELPSVAEVQQDCLVTVAGAKASGPAALEYPDGSLWVWGELSWTAPRGAEPLSVHNAGVWVSDASQACEAELSLIEDDAERPLVLLPLTAAEAEDNAARDDGRRWALQPLGGFVEAGRGYLYYDKQLLGPGFFDVRSAGVGLCVFDDPQQPCRRLESGPGSDEPTLLWTDGLPWRSSSGLVDGGHAYLLTCSHAAAFLDPCVLGRVAVEDAGDPAAYSWANWGQDDGWTQDRFNAAVVIDSPGQVTLRRSETLDGWQIVATDIWRSRLTLLFANDIDGPYQPQGKLLDAQRPRDWFIVGGREHLSLGSPDGSTLALSYSVDPDGQGQQLHLVTVRLEAELR